MGIEVEAQRTKCQEQTRIKDVVMTRACPGSSGSGGSPANQGRPVILSETIFRVLPAIKQRMFHFRLSSTGFHRN
jgi:hypothetical protein